MKQAKTKPFLMRLKPETKGLLEKAKEDQRRSISSLIDESVRNQLGYRYGTLDGLKTETEAQAWTRHQIAQKMLTSLRSL